jgi:hypothetical protein
MCPHWGLPAGKGRWEIAEACILGSCHPLGSGFLVPWGTLAFGTALSLPPPFPPPLSHYYPNICSPICSGDLRNGRALQGLWSLGPEARVAGGAEMIRRSPCPES